MTLRKTAAILGLILVFMTGTAFGAATPEETFRKNFPNIRMDSIAPTAITGLYEIVSEGRVLYYAPGPEYLVAGQLITQEMRNLTEERAEEIIGRKLKATPLEKALKIGSGPHTVIEITDPDCTFCRKASAFLSSRNDVTRHIFFYPLSIHPNAEAKVRHIFCATDRARAYEEAMTGKLDDMKFTPCEDPQSPHSFRPTKRSAPGSASRGHPFFSSTDRSSGGPTSRGWKRSSAAK